MAPGFARTCAFCAAGGPLWFLAYADTPAGAVSGAVSLCAACRTDLEAGDGDPVLERALALLDPAVSQAARNREHRRVRERIAWLLTHRVGVPRLARDLLIEAPRAAPATPDSARNTT